MLFNMYGLWVMKELYNNSFVVVVSKWITHHHSIIYTKDHPVSHAYIISYGGTIEFIFLYIIHQYTYLFPGIQYVVCRHYSFVPLQLLNDWSSMQNILISNKLTHHHSIILYMKLHWAINDMQCHSAFMPNFTSANVYY